MKNETEDISERMVILNINDLIPYENNPRFNDEAVEAVANSIKEFGFKVPIVVDKNNVIVAGHTRWKACKKLGIEEVPCIVADDLTDDQIKAFRLADNKVGELATWDFTKLEEELANIEMDMADFNFDIDELEMEFSKDEEPEKISLAEKFIVPPFSVLDTRQGYWIERKREWKSKIDDDGSRGTSSLMAGIGHIQKDEDSGYADNSVIDPVLCEVILKWFTPCEKSNVFDCFAGDTGFGFVSEYLGHAFTGIELRPEQVSDNVRRLEAKGLNANYMCDDGRNVLNHVEEKSQDLLFSCPPYFDLEVYSDKENDASNQKTYEEFYQILDTAFTNAGNCLKDNRFAVIVCGDIRNKKTGGYYGFPESIKNTFRRNGFELWNELILLEPIGNRRLLANKYMETRKVAKTHQNVLVFYKGDNKTIKNDFKALMQGVDYAGEDMESE